MELRATINGTSVEADVPPNELLLDFLRDRMQLTGAKRSCDVQVCGACTVLLDGAPVSSCCILACDADGREVLTVEGLAGDPVRDRVAAAFIDGAAVQCGFCIPGFVMTLHGIAQAGGVETREQLCHELKGNLCRCTGYRALVDAACTALGVDET